MIGITPQIKLSERTLLTLDFTALSNVRQRLNWDGTESARENNLAGLLYTSSLGLTFYLGKNEKHSDWVIVEKTTQVETELLKRISTLEALLVDTDKDGVADVKDLQNNTPSGLNVDAKGQFIDTDNNGTPDELEVEKIQEIKAQNLAAASEQSENNTFKSLLNNGLVNIFYDINKDEPNNASTNSIYGIISLLRNNPSYKIKLTGYSDRTGSEIVNKNLSERRVKKIYDIILLGGIAPERIKIIGEGVDNSISSNSKTALQLARRVSILMD
jgi:OOP family OmpA-OmpF porin